jgi:hypothetical protein
VISVKKIKNTGRRCTVKISGKYVTWQNGEIREVEGKEVKGLLKSSSQFVQWNGVIEPDPADPESFLLGNADQVRSRIRSMVDPDPEELRTLIAEERARDDRKTVVRELQKRLEEAEENQE